MVGHALAAARRAGVRRLVLNLAAWIDPDSDEPIFRTLRAAQDAALAANGTGALETVVLEPTVYMDNLLAPWSLPAITGEGVLGCPAPAEASISWVSHRSLGEFARAAVESGAPGRAYPIGGPEALTGAQLCRTLGERLEREVRYERIPLDAFAAALDGISDAPGGQRVAGLYRSLERHPRAAARDAAAFDALGVRPESLRDFVARAF